MSKNFKIQTKQATNDQRQKVLQNIRLENKRMQKKLKKQRQKPIVTVVKFDLDEFFPKFCLFTYKTDDDKFDADWFIAGSDYYLFLAKTAPEGHAKSVVDEFFQIINCLMICPSNVIYEGVKIGTINSDGLVTLQEMFKKIKLATKRAVMEQKIPYDMFIGAQVDMDANKIVLYEYPEAAMND